MAWYGLAGMIWYMVWSARHSIYCLEGMAGYMVWPGGHGMVYREYQVYVF